MVFSLLLAGGAFAVVAWLMFNLSVFALPLLVGISAATVAQRGGAGFVGAALLGLACAAVAFALGRIAFEKASSPFWRAMLAIAFVVPAAFAGYCWTFGVVALLVPSQGWRLAFSLGGALVTATVAYTRLSAFDPTTRASEAATPLGRRLGRASRHSANPPSLSGLARSRRSVRGRGLSPR